MIYHNPYIIGVVVHPLATLNNRGFDSCSSGVNEFNKQKKYCYYPEPKNVSLLVATVTGGASQIQLYVLGSESGLPG